MPREHRDILRQPLLPTPLSAVLLAAALQKRLDLKWVIPDVQSRQLPIVGQKTILMVHRFVSSVFREQVSFGIVPFRVECSAKSQSQ